jgi:hypothetical protein
MARICKALLKTFWQFTTLCYIATGNNNVKILLISKDGINMQGFIKNFLLIKL